ncbi:uncharacterized protein HMPREF1120_04525 [Exophiala dermatitidis NIH/UT8656]|uniref:Uncharacterized protein n=1 Tax=Exophiala dermatitidis (strain ATCC 34100 / CBS 525.76 / NIH/UT8656) TaxID=858893 RepID=H6C0R9_EXODN|nr:uncharacterized protein HMPREF1120_04525 [Exophiala dermatitidis NIH/UT8656]EHY56443.1 hypothetical protein HMPREF1120_04525 [Exophiala dermatitidis NIH/UT8656]
MIHWRMNQHGRVHPERERVHLRSIVRVSARIAHGCILHLIACIERSGCAVGERRLLQTMLHGRIVEGSSRHFTEGRHGLRIRWWSLVTCPGLRVSMQRILIVWRPRTVSQSFLRSGFILVLECLRSFEMMLSL